MDVLDLFDDAAKGAAFEKCWGKLQTSSGAYGTLDLDMLRVCIKLLPIANSETPHAQLLHLVLQSISKRHSDQHLYDLAEICTTNVVFARAIFEYIYRHLAALPAARNQPLNEPHSGQARATQEEHIRRAVAYLNLLKCSYWLPAHRLHYVTPAWIQALVDLLGWDELDDVAHEALSALLSLLKSPSAIPQNLGQARLTNAFDGPDAASQGCLIEQQLWARLSQLPSAYFTSNSGRAFRTWFQWTSLAETNGVVLEGVYDPVYWTRLQSGLLYGFSEQRKYCLGILRHSIQVTRHSINTPQMTLDFDRKTEYQRQYEKYYTLFEIIVLDRYQNQIQACLPELTAVLGPHSLITPGWQTTLLSAALNSRVQDGTRKLIGKWYIDHIIKESGSVVGHLPFFIHGFLPWATQGSLFTSSLNSSRKAMSCTHGNDLVDVLSKFVIFLPTSRDRRRLFTDVLHFMLDKGGKIFQHTIMYMLESLFVGFDKCSSFKDLELEDLEVLLRVSRLTGLPEIATDLCVVYCARICDKTLAGSEVAENLPGYDVLKAKFRDLQEHHAYEANNVKKEFGSQMGDDHVPSLGQFLTALHDTQHMSIQDDFFVPACAEVTEIFDRAEFGSLQLNEMCEVLEALWDEAERQDFRRPIVVQVPPLFFHRICILYSVERKPKYSESPLTRLLTRVMDQLKKLAVRRSYLASVLATSLRRAALSNPDVVYVLPFEDFLVDFVRNPPVAKTEFLFEVAAAEKLQQYLPHRDYASYYGRREWYAYAAIVDFLSRVPNTALLLAHNILERLVKPWANQKPPIPIISKWKSSFQLQAILLLTESCITSSNAEEYLDSFTAALMVESWPRYRHLLEWIIARIYYQCPNLAPRLLDTLANLDDGSPMQVASLMKLAMLVAPILDSEKFALNLMTQLVPFSSHNKVQVRHEAHWSVPIIWNLAVEKDWRSITNNPAFKALNNFVLSLERFSLPPSSIRTLKLDAVADYSVKEIFQGRYLSIETPEPELFSVSDIRKLHDDDDKADLSFLARTNLSLSVNRVPLGNLTPDLAIPSLESLGLVDEEKAPEPAPTTFQTKSGFDLDSLLPVAGPPSERNKRPASVILVASLINNPTNLGGLSRISESFGLEALYIDDKKHIAHKDFKATSVTSEKHLEIRELQVADVPEKLVEWKREGWEVVGVEQTDRSGILGARSHTKVDEEGCIVMTRGDGILPQKCVLVLGSEKGGISAEVLAVMDRCVEIKTSGVTRSLNVQTAGGVAVYEWWREWGGKI